MKKFNKIIKSITAAVAFFIITNSNAQEPSNFKFSQGLCDTLNHLQVGINFEPTKYKKGFNYINEDGYKVTLLNYIHVYTQFGVNIYRWQAKVYFKNGLEIITFTDDYWLDINSDKAYYDIMKKEIVYKRKRVKGPKPKPYAHLR